MLERLTGIKYKFKKTDCYWLVNKARKELGLQLLPSITYSANDYNDKIKETVNSHFIEITIPYDGCVVVIQSINLALGCLYNGKVLCFNQKNISELIDMKTIPIIKYIDVIK